MKTLDRYLGALDDELRDLPPARRREIVEDIREHLHEAAPADETALRTVLDDLGDPAEIAAEARERFGVEPRRGRAQEIAAIVLLLIGGLVVPFVGWVAGAVLLWTSKVWSTRDKWLATLVVPGGLLLPVLLELGAIGATTELCGTNASGDEVCTGGRSDTEIALWWAVMSGLVVGPIAVAVRLARRL